MSDPTRDAIEHAVYAAIRPASEVISADEAHRLTAIARSTADAVFAPERVVPAASHREAVAQAIRPWLSGAVRMRPHQTDRAVDAVLVVTEAAQAVAVRDAVADDRERIQRDLRMMEGEMRSGEFWLRASAVQRAVQVQAEQAQGGRQPKPGRDRER